MGRPRRGSSRLALFLAFASLLTLIAACTVEPPRPAATPPVLIRAESAFQNGEYARAIEAYRAFLKDPTDDSYAPRAWYKLALSQYRLQEYRGCIATLDELAHQYPKESWPQAATLRGDAHEALGNTISALEAWTEAWRLADQKDRPALRARFDRVVKTMGEAERARALDVISEPVIRAWIEQPPSNMGATSPTEVQTPGQVAVPVTAPTAPAAVPSTVRVACLLPLSGPYRAFGERSLQGIQLALGSERDRLIVKDTHGSPEVARTAFSELANRADVIAVIGPLRSNEASAVAPLAASAQLPLLLLAQREGLTNSYVLQTAMTRSEQATQLTAHAQQAHWLQLGILAPNDKYGHEFTEQFRTAAAARGVHISWSETYEPHSPEITTQVAHARERRTHSVLDAVFVPDTASAAITVGAALRAAMPDVGLLGPNDWHNPTALAGAGAALDGAVFVAGFFADSARPVTRAFVESFRRAHGDAPDIFAAEGYDAAILLREALQRGTATRAAAVETLHHLDAVAGATSMLRVTESSVEHELFLLRVVGGKLEEVTSRPGER